MYVIVSICFVEKLGQPIILPLRPKQKWCFVVNYWDGEKFGRPILSPPWLVKTSTIPSREYAYNLGFLGGGGKLGRPILSPLWQDKASTWCRCLSGRRKTRLVHSYPTLTSGSINLTLSWICKQPLLFRGWEKVGRPILSLPWQDEASNLCRWLSRWRKTHWIFLSQPWLVKVSTLPCHEYTYNLSFLGGGGKTRLAHAFPTLPRSSINLVQMVILVEKNLAGPFFSQPDKWNH